MENNFLSYEEVKLLNKLLLIGIGNGNTVNPEVFIPTPEEYNMMFDIRNKLK